MAGRSRKIKQIDVQSGIPEGYGYCRRCREVKLSTSFFSAIDLNLDKNGLMSVCKNCIDEMLSLTLQSESGSIQKAILKLCKTLNVMYSDEAIASALKQIESKGSDPSKIFGYYKAKLLVIERTDVNDTTVDLTYKDSPTINISNEFSSTEQDYKDFKDLRLFWGENFTKDEIEILESKYSEWSRSHNIDTQSERVLLKYICLKELEIDKAVIKGTSTASLVKEFQDLLKTAALAPSQSNAASGGKSMDSFGLWLKDISELRPEEWVEDKSIYKDVDDIQAYGEKFITAPLRSLVTGSREFTLEANEEIEDDVVEGE